MNSIKKAIALMGLIIFVLLLFFSLYSTASSLFTAISDGFTEDNKSELYSSFGALVVSGLLTSATYKLYKSN